MTWLLKSVPGGFIFAGGLWLMVAGVMIYYMTQDYREEKTGRDK